MKKGENLLITFFCLLALWGCSKNASTTEEDQEAESYTISFALKGDITITETPLSRAANNDLYGINVYYNKDNDNIINDVYGYGLFDCIDSMKIPLLTGYKYKFICSLIRNAKNELFYGKATICSSDDHRYYTSSEEGYCFPFGKSDFEYEEYSSNYSTSIKSSHKNGFYYYNNMPTKLENKFILGNNYHLTGLGSGNTHEKEVIEKNKNQALQDYRSISSQASVYEGFYTKYPTSDRYYGEITNYSPTPNGTVTIDLKRCTFGFKIVTKGLEGQLVISVNDYNSLLYCDTIKSVETESKEMLYTFNDTYFCWKIDNYSKSFNIDITWIRNSNITQKLPQQQITFKRNVITTITIDLNGTSNDAPFGLNMETTPMANENIDIKVNQEDTDVKPQE